MDCTLIILFIREVSEQGHCHSLLLSCPESRESGDPVVPPNLLDISWKVHLASPKDVLESQVQRSSWLGQNNLSNCTCLHHSKVFFSRNNPPSKDVVNCDSLRSADHQQAPPQHSRGLLYLIWFVLDCCNPANSFPTLAPSVRTYSLHCSTEYFRRLILVIMYILPYPPPTQKLCCSDINEVQSTRFGVTYNRG